MKSLIPKFQAKISENCDIVFSNLILLKQYLLKFRNLEVEITIKKKGSEKQRTNNENSYYWGVVIAMIATHTGNTEESIHEALKQKFLKHDDKYGLTLVQGTSNLNTSDFEEYLKQIREWSANYLGLYIPLPNEINY